MEALFVSCQLLQSTDVILPSYSLSLSALKSQLSQL